MDELAQYNKERWEALAQANVPYSRPILDLTPESARALVDAEGLMDEPAGKDVLCLAGGGGQQSAAFALLGARVTVLDLSETQLERDQAAAAHYGVRVRTIPGDMRDLSGLPADGFDIVWHAHSLNFVPDAGQVFDQVVRVLRPGGQYRVDWCNPYLEPIETEQWTGQGFLLNQPIVEGRELHYIDPRWSINQGPGKPDVRVVGPREFLHTAPAVVNGLIARRFAILGLWESGRRDPNSAPGTWDHLASLIPPWVIVWARKTR
jgi:SAM-dependent methyltransferase